MVLRARDLLEKAYYQFLFATPSPYVQGLSRKLGALCLQPGRGDIPVPAEIWESQYRHGDWSFLRDLDERARYSVIAGYIHALKHNPAVLDVGCGEGILLECLGESGYCKFVGLDISQTAVDRAENRQFPRSVFVKADAQDYRCNEMFDVIVFNEVLYYFHEPLAMTTKYSRWLNAGGFLIASMFSGSNRARAIGRQLKKTYPVIDELEIMSHGSSWRIDVLSPSGETPPGTMDPGKN